MQWFYAVEGQQKGPIAPEELVRLTLQGVVTDRSLVWRDGLPGWQPLASVKHELPHVQSAPPTPSPGETGDPATGLSDSENPYAPPRSAVEEETVPASAQDDRWPERGIGAIFSHTFQIMGQGFIPLNLAYLSIWGPLNFLLAFYEYNVIAPDDVLGVMRGQMLAEGFIGIIAVGAVISIAEAIWNGQPYSMGNGLSHGASSWARLWVARFLSGFCILAAGLALILPLFWVGTRLVLVDAVVIKERASGPEAIRRSWELTRNRFWPIFGAMILATLCLIVPLMFLGAILAIPGLDVWWLSASLDCAVTPALVFFTVFAFVIYKHHAAGNPQG